jgi:hypothetical protein
VTRESYSDGHNSGSRNHQSSCRHLRGTLRKRGTPAGRRQRLHFATVSPTQCEVGSRLRSVDEPALMSASTQPSDLFVFSFVSVFSAHDVKTPHQCLCFAFQVGLGLGPGTFSPSKNPNVVPNNVHGSRYNVLIRLLDICFSYHGFRSLDAAVRDLCKSPNWCAEPGHRSPYGALSGRNRHR